VLGQRWQDPAWFRRPRSQFGAQSKFNHRLQYDLHATSRGDVEKALELRRRCPARAIVEKPPACRLHVRRPFATARQRGFAVGEEQRLAAPDSAPLSWRIRRSGQPIERARQGALPSETLAAALGRRQERRRGDARQLEPLGDRGAEWFHQTRSDDEISAPCALSVRSTWCVGLDERWRWTLKTL